MWRSFLVTTPPILLHQPCGLSMEWLLQAHAFVHLVPSLLKEVGHWCRPNLFVLCFWDAMWPVSCGSCHLAFPPHCYVFPHNNGTRSQTSKPFSFKLLLSGYLTKQWERNQDSHKGEHPNFTGTKTSQSKVNGKSGNSRKPTRSIKSGWQDLVNYDFKT